jgi:excisionase family DNA binding protein
LFPTDGLNTIDVAHVLGVDVSTVRRYIRDGHLAAVRVGQELIIMEEDVRAFVEAQREKKRENQRVARVRQEIDEYIRNVRSTPLAQEVALTYCPKCIRLTPLTLYANRDAGIVVWRGPCRYCGETFDLDYDQCRSLAETTAVEEQAATATASDPFDF